MLYQVQIREPDGTLGMFAQRSFDPPAVGLLLGGVECPTCNMPNPTIWEWAVAFASRKRTHWRQSVEIHSEASERFVLAPAGSQVAMRADADDDHRVTSPPEH